LMTNKLKPERIWLYPIIVLARASVYRGERPYKALAIVEER
jgi:hypothetical protein